MRTYDFAPLFRSTVGFDRLFDMLDNSPRPVWPPSRNDDDDDPPPCPAVIARFPRSPMSGGVSVTPVLAMAA